MPCNSYDQCIAMGAVGVVVGFYLILAGTIGISVTLGFMWSRARRVLHNHDRRDDE